MHYTIPPKTYFEIAALGYLLVLHLISAFDSGKQTRTGYLFRRFGFIMFIALNCSILTYVFAVPEAGTPLWVCMLLRTCDSVSCVLTAQQFCIYLLEYVDEEGRYRWLIILDWTLFYAYLFLMLLNIPLHFILYYAPNGEYIHGAAFVPVVFLPPIFFIGSALFALLIRAGYLERRGKTALAIACFVTLLGTIVQAATGGRILLSLPFGSIGVFVLYFSLEAPDYRRLQESNERLILAEQDAVKANRAKSDFLASMSHEIRTPLNAVLGMDEMILRETAPGAEAGPDKLRRIRSYSENIKDAGGILLSVINDILDLSKIESGKMEIVREPYHFGKVLRDVDTMTRVRAEQKGLYYISKADPEMPEYLCGDGMRIRQIILNILNNAVKYTEEGSVELEIHAENRTEEKLDLVITVSDTGSGIKPEDLPNVFRAFERVNEEVNRRIEGTGLGLSIVQRLCTLMDGEVQVRSVYGKGSIFTVTIPQPIAGEGVIREYEEREKAQKSRAESQEFRTPDCRFLLVDDNRMNQLVAKHFLDELGAVITTADSGVKALEMMRGEKYDLIFMDHMMPEMDGIQTLHASRTDPENRNLDTPMIMMTANALNGMREEYLEQGFNDYISKPIDRKELMKVVRRLLPEEKVTESDTV